MSPSHSSSFPGPALTALRAATRDRHARLDALIALESLAERNHYVRTLAVLATVLPAWERAVHHCLPVEPRAWYASRTRTPWLFADLATLRTPPPQADAPPDFRSQGEAWGAAYVLEGSALGGQVIARHVRAAGLDGGASYFHGFGAATGGMWREFCVRLESALATNALRDDACAAACRLFDRLGGAMAEAHSGSYA